jgi:hypothetical protein
LLSPKAERGSPLVQLAHAVVSQGDTVAADTLLLLSRADAPMRRLANEAELEVKAR